MTSTFEAQLATGKPLVYFTVGDSMEPLLYDRETHVTICAAQGDLRPGDLPLYRRPTGQYVLHRIIRADGESYYTRGDNRTGLERVPKAWVLGVVTEITRHGKHISVTDRTYRLYVAAWGVVYPLRWCCYKVRGLLRFISRRLKMR